VGDDKRQERAADGDGSDKEGKDGKGDGDGNEGAGQQRGQGRHGPWHRQQGWRATKRAMAMAARAMVMRVAGEQQQQGRWQQKANNNGPAMGSTKAGGGWRESIDEATTQPRRWATMNDKSVRQMMMAAMKRARVERAMVTATAMRVVGNEEGKGNDKKDGVGNEGGVQRRGQWRRLQERWQRG
jgi:hypothetical protein